MDTPENIPNSTIDPILPIDNCKLSLIEKIDFVLNYLSWSENRNTYRGVNDVMIAEVKFYKRQNFYGSIAREDIVLIIRKLMKEKHLDIFPKIEGDPIDEVFLSSSRFKITFDGLLWFERGGYQGEIDRNSLAERRVRISQTVQYILAFGVSTPFLWYLLDTIRLYRSSWFDLCRICVLAVVCACLGAALWYILLLIEKRRKLK